MKRILAVVLASTLAFSANMAGAKDKAPTDLKFPTKDITYLVPYSAGGSSDQMARAMVNYAKKYLGVDLIIENVGGGGGNVGLVLGSTIEKGMIQGMIICKGSFLELMKRPLAGTILALAALLVFLTLLKPIRRFLSQSKEG